MASVNFKYEIKGAENLKKRLRAENLLMTPLRNFMNGSGKIIKEKSREHAPVDTGALRRSIKYTRVKIKEGFLNQQKFLLQRNMHHSFMVIQIRNLECQNHLVEQDHTSHQSKHLLVGQRDMV
ncbi:MAG: hypothetical protein CM15mV92_280 [Caudoviricetes sp.]|nr:MAG: hypothetical protein CM15mV92_280 [Caudoviricetes sp.]